MSAPAAILGTLAALVAAASASAQEAPSLKGYPVYRLAQDGGGLGYSIDDTIVFMETYDSQPSFWVAERRQREKQVATPQTFRHQWIDGRRCPGLTKVLASIGDLPAVRIGPPDNRDHTLTFDTTRIALAGPMTAGEPKGTRVTIAQEVGWLHTWWRTAQKELAPCWRNSPRSEGGGPPLPTMLFTDQDAKEMKP